MKCCKCGKELPPDSKFCQYCGEDLSKIKCCPFCGFQLRDDMGFCPQCGEKIRDAASAQPAASNGTIQTREEVTIPVWEEPAAIVSEPALPGASKKQENATVSWGEPLGCPTNVQESFWAEQTAAPEEPISESDEETRAEEELPEEERPPTAGDQIRETDEAGSASLRGKKGKRLLTAVLCAAAAAAAGIYLWMSYAPSSGRPDSNVDISEIADSVLYLEVFDEHDELIGSASGFLVNDQSTLVTNYHVAQDAWHIVAKTADGTRSTDVSCILAYDEIADLAVLRCDAEAMVKPLTVGNSETVRQGDAVYAVGYPLGLANTLSNGIVSSRYIDEYDNDIIQVTAAISEGNSGGPLLNANGQVIGVMCAYYIYGQNLNIAIASDALKALLVSGYEETNLKDWKDRPAMPDAEAEIEEIQGPDAQEAGGDPVGNTGSESGAEPEGPKVTDDDNLPGTGGPKQGEPSQPAAPRRPEEILQGGWMKEPLEYLPSAIYDYVEFSGDRVYYESYYCSSEVESILVYTGTFTIDENGSLCFHMTREEMYFPDGRQKVNDALDVYWEPHLITALSEDSYTTDGILTYYKTSDRPAKLSEWKVNAQNKQPTAFSFLSEWITNNSNLTMGEDKAYQEIQTDEDAQKTYKVIYSAGVNQICLMNTIDYYSGLSFWTFLWLTPTGKSFNSTFYQYDAVASVNIFKGSGVIHAPSFKENSAYTFDSYEGDSTMLDTRQSAAKLMYLDSLDFLDYLFYTYALPSGYQFSTSDFGFNI